MRFAVSRRGLYGQERALKRSKEAKRRGEREARWLSVSGKASLSVAQTIRAVVRQLARRAAKRRWREDGGMREQTWNNEENTLRRRVSLFLPSWSLLRRQSHGHVLDRVGHRPVQPISNLKATKMTPRVVEHGGRGRA